MLSWSRGRGSCYSHRQGKQEPCPVPNPIRSSPTAKIEAPGEWQGSRIRHQCCILPWAESSCRFSLRPARLCPGRDEASCGIGSRSVACSSNQASLVLVAHLLEAWEMQTSSCVEEVFRKTTVCVSNEIFFLHPTQKLPAMLGVFVKVIRIFSDSCPSFCSLLSM